MFKGGWIRRLGHSNQGWLADEEWAEGVAFSSDEHFHDEAYATLLNGLFREFCDDFIQA